MPIHAAAQIIISFGLFLIEILGLCIKHLILAVRLLANMVAGHLVLLGIMGLITAAASASTGTWATVTVISVVSATLFSVLELFVAFLLRGLYFHIFVSTLCRCSGSPPLMKSTNKKKPF